MSTDNISVIIPTYNRSSFLGDAITSVVQQTKRCLEVVVIDDGSIDDTKGIVDRLSESSDIEIRYFYQENRGVAAARNSGIVQSKGDLLAFLDSDDLWNRNKLDHQYQLMSKNPDYLISHTREKWLRRGQHLNQKRKHIPRHGDIFDHCLELCAVGMSTVMVRRELFDKVGVFDESYPCCEDYELWLRVSAKYHFLLVDEPLTVKNGGREDQLSQQFRVGMDRYRINALEKQLNAGLADEGKCRALKKELVKKLTIYGNGCIRHDRLDEGKKCLDRASSIYEQIGI